jgi:hypothetical protein
MSHLQCFSAQRDLANKSASSPWGFNQHHNLYAAPGVAYGDVQHPFPNHADILGGASTTAATSSASTPSTSAANGSSSSTTTSQANANPYNNNGAWAGQQPIFSQSAAATAAAAAAASENALYAQMKPYRPWGAELAY